MVKPVIEYSDCIWSPKFPVPYQGYRKCPVTDDQVIVISSNNGDRRGLVLFSATYTA